MASSTETVRRSTFKQKTSYAMRTGLLENRSRHVDTRPIWVRLSDYLPLILPYGLLAIGVLLLFVPAWSYFIFLLALVLMLWMLFIQFDYLVSAPLNGRRNGIVNWQKGVAYLLLGYDLLFHRQLWIEVDRETRMLFISGTTGSGKTVTLNSMLLQAGIQGHLPKGAPIMVTDGKGSIKGLYEWLFYMVRTGRLHDIRILNFLTAGKKQNPDAMLDDDHSSNKFNPFSVLNADESRGLIMSFGRSSEGGNSEFFRDRASTMCGGVFEPLCYKRDVLGEPLDVSVIQRFTELRNMFQLAASKDLPDKYLKPLREYLKTLNGVDDSHFQMEIDQGFEINQKAEEQHTYNRSMLSKTINEMAESLGHIFCSVGSDINLRNAFMHGQAVFVLLPTIEKEPDAMAELGRMTIGSLRPALSPLLGYKVQGSYGETVKSLPSNRTIPIRLYFDEVLNYYVKGISGFLSLLRSVNVSLVLMGQSLKGIYDAGESEGRQSLANLNNKLMFSTQDVYETMDLIEKSVGKTTATHLSQMHSEAWGGYRNSEQLNLAEESIVNARDMAGADPMEGLYLFRSDIIPFKSSTLFPDESRDGELDFFRLNLFAELREPDSDELERVSAMISVFNEVRDGSFSGEPPAVSTSTIIQDFAQRLSAKRAAAERFGTAYDNPLYMVAFTLVDDLLEDDEVDYQAQRNALVQASSLQRQQSSSSYQASTIILADEEDVQVVDSAEVYGTVNFTSEHPDSSSSNERPDSAISLRSQHEDDHSPEAMMKRSQAAIGMTVDPMAQLGLYNDSYPDDLDVRNATSVENGSIEDMPTQGELGFDGELDVAEDREFNPTEIAYPVTDVFSSPSDRRDTGSLGHLLVQGAEREALLDSLDGRAVPFGRMAATSATREDDSASAATSDSDEYQSAISDRVELASKRSSTRSSGDSATSDAFILGNAPAVQELINDAQTVTGVDMTQVQNELLDTEHYAEEPTPVVLTKEEQEAYVEHVTNQLMTDMFR
ncbi:type IV secretion system DNA-binding domain-containing protein [Vibrio vulnificus]|nr:type IV secretion system DNA-binding domain-containing protein [Vibrio vulnificus]